MQTYNILICGGTIGECENQIRCGVMNLFLLNKLEILHWSGTHHEKSDNKNRTHPTPAHGARRVRLSFNAPLHRCCFESNPILPVGFDEDRRGEP